VAVYHIRGANYLVWLLLDQVLARDCRFVLGHHDAPNCRPGRSSDIMPDADVDRQVRHVIAILTCWQVRSRFQDYVFNKNTEYHKERPCCVYWCLALPEKQHTRDAFQPRPLTTVSKGSLDRPCSRSSLQRQRSQTPTRIQLRPPLHIHAAGDRRPGALGRWRHGGRSMPGMQAPTIRRSARTE
jgi:hypothetical protein